MDKWEIFFFIYYGITIQLFIVPIALNQMSEGAKLGQIVSDSMILLFEEIGIILFVIPLTIGFYILIRAYLQNRRKQIIG